MTLIAGRYELGDTIGNGGMSEVFAAKDTILGRDVAVKMLRQDLARDVHFRERFRREAQNSSKLNHAAIVAVYDTGETTQDGLNIPYIVMERVHGRTLRDIVREQGPLSPSETARILIPVAEALQASHDAGIIHRDIKPANVMLTNTGAVKVMDFGIARALDDATSAMTQTSAVIGTAQYLSPEQARGKLADARSDVYALGCVAYEVLTGRPPFEGETPFAVAYQHVQENPARPSEFIADLSPTAAVNVDAVVLTAMAKHPADRYQTAAAMAEDLARLERNAVTDAARSYLHTAEEVAPAPAATTKTSSDNRVLKTIAAVLAVAVLGVGGAFAYDYWRTQSQEQQMVTLPRVEGRTQQEAVASLEALGLQVQVNEEPSPDVKRGVVLRSNPAMGSRVHSGALVSLTVSSGREVTEVPNLVGMNTADAARVLSEAGLELHPEVREESSTEVKSGDIVEHSPSAGAQVARGSQVTITVSSGEPTDRVPVLTGQQVAQAEENLRAMGFEPVIQQVDGSEPAGQVLRVSGQGTQQPKGSEVVVEVSNGMLITMPNITGMLPNEAVAALHRAGWQGTESKLTQGERVPTALLVDQGHIASQVPEAGQQVRKDASIPIRLYVFDISALGR